MSVRTTCPYCNAEFAADSVPPAARVACQRCGESFAPAAWRESAEPSLLASAPIYNPNANRTVVRSMILGVLLLGVVGSYSLLRNRPPQSPPEPPRSAAVMPPAKVLGLNYMPAQASILFAVQPAALAELTGKIPKDLLTAAGVPAEVIDRIGVPLQSIEQIVGSLTFASDNLVPGLTLFIRFRTAGAESAAFRESLKLQHKPQAGRLYTTKFFNLLMTPLGDSTFLFGLTDNDLPDAGRKISRIGQFAEPIRQGLEGLSPASLIWIVTDDRDWSKASPLLQLPEGKKLAAKLARGRCLAAGLSWEQEPVLHGTVKLADTASAVEFERFLSENLPAERTLERKDTMIGATARTSFESMGQLIRKARNELFK